MRKDEDELFEADIASYTFATYLRDRWALLLIIAFCLAGTAVMLSILGVGAQACALVVGFVAACFVTVLIGDFARRARFYQEIARYAQQVGRITQFTSLVCEPEFLEGRVTYQVIDQLATVANNQSNAERDQAQAHRNYIELWIHEIKTPIAAAKLMLASMHGEQALKLKSELERIEAQVDQALYSARAGSLSNDYAIRELKLACVVGAACKKNAHFLIERNVAAAIEVPDDVCVLADEPWLTFVLSQIITNAAKYGARSITFTTHEEEPDTPRGRTVLEVRDDGCGIPAADVPRVFDRGFTGEVGRAHGSATGMGLYLVAVMCARMGLGVGLASEQGKGTRVLLTFPHDRRRALTENPPPAFSFEP